MRQLTDEWEVELALSSTSAPTRSSAFSYGGADGGGQDSHHPLVPETQAGGVRPSASDGLVTC